MYDDIESLCKILRHEETIADEKQKPNLSQLHNLAWEIRAEVLAEIRGRLQRLLIKHE